MFARKSSQNHLRKVHASTSNFKAQNTMHKPAKQCNFLIAFTVLVPAAFAKHLNGETSRSRTTDVNLSDPRIKIKRRKTRYRLQRR